MRFLAGVLVKISCPCKRARNHHKRGVSCAWKSRPMGDRGCRSHASRWGPLARTPLPASITPPLSHSVGFSLGLFIFMFFFFCVLFFIFLFLPFRFLRIRSRSDAGSSPELEYRSLCVRRMGELFGSAGMVREKFARSIGNAGVSYRARINKRPSAIGFIAYRRGLPGTGVMGRCGLRSDSARSRVGLVWASVASQRRHDPLPGLGCNSQPVQDLPRFLHLCTLSHLLCLL